MIAGRPLVPGRGDGELLRLSAPLSLWGGVDPRTGLLCDPRHPEHGASVVGRVLAVPACVGSSSSSAIMLELIREGTAPAAVLLGRADTILALGVVVARELGYPVLPVVEVGEVAIAELRNGRLEVREDGSVRAATR